MHGCFINYYLKSEVHDQRESATGEYLRNVGRSISQRLHNLHSLRINHHNAVLAAVGYVVLPSPNARTQQCRKEEEEKGVDALAWWTEMRTLFRPLHVQCPLTSLLSCSSEG